MNIIYDLQTDSLIITLRDVPVKESDEIRDCLVADYGVDDHIVAIEMLDVSANVSDPDALLYDIKGRATTVLA